MEVCGERHIVFWSIDSNGGYLVGGFQFGLGSLKGLEGGELDFLKKCLSLKDLLRFWYSSRMDWLVGGGKGV